MPTTEPCLSINSNDEISKGNAQVTDPDKCSYGLYSPFRDDSWVVDSATSDHMTFDATDFAQTSQPRRTCIANTNGVLSLVTGVGTINLSPTLSLTYCLLVPSLSHKLLSVSRITTTLNCVVLVTRVSNFLCISRYS